MPRSRKSAPRRRRRSSAPRRRRSRASARFRGDERTPAQKIRDDFVQQYDETLRSFVATLNAYREKTAPTQEEFVALCVGLQACARDLRATRVAVGKTYTDAHKNAFAKLDESASDDEWRTLLNAWKPGLSDVQNTVRTKQEAFERIKWAITGFAQDKGILCSQPVVGEANKKVYAFDKEANGILDANMPPLPR